MTAYRAHLMTAIQRAQAAGFFHFAAALARLLEKSSQGKNFSPGDLCKSFEYARNVPIWKTAFDIIGASCTKCQS